MPHDLSIRTATRDDLPALLELYRHLVPDEYDLDIEQAADIWERFSRYDGSAIHVGVLDGVPVSTCTLIVVPNLTRGGVPYALVENVTTHAEHRGRGHGKAVIEAAVAKAWDHGCYKVMLLTGSKNPATLGFYERAGFQRTKTGFEMRRLPPREI
ncbi:GNAT family N-acetyltransferase [Mesorhizobium sp. KR1-2]|uniref:GNAT family N-acetyltransferase n=1 Tax=Mesorhizobium sp. KR1-2 TaxID=3156609 RepID=UPI0032B5AD18